jgi:hypothetical protein
MQKHTSPKRYQSFGHTQQNCNYTPVRFVTGLNPVLLGHCKAADTLPEGLGKVGESQERLLHG